MTQPLLGMTVVIADDAQATRHVVQQCVASLGCNRIYFASTPAEVMRLVAEESPDLILSEFHLSDQCTGQQLLEELRASSRQHWKTSFAIITAEQRYHAVFGAAEFEPDAYIIKPFTETDLAARIVQLFQRKAVLQPIYIATAESRYDDALVHCDALIDKQPDYLSEILRLNIALLLRLNDQTQAVYKLEEAIRRYPVPWMHMALAKIKIQQKQYDAAEFELRQVIQQTPNYIHAHDLLADVMVEQDRGTEAIELLEGLGDAALQNIDRLRKLADLATRTNDVERTTLYLQKAINRSKGSVQCSADDFVSLSSVLIAEGRLQEAECVALNMQLSVKGEELQAARLLIDISKSIRNSKLNEAHAHLQQLIAIFHPSRKRLPSTELHASVVENCFELNMRDEGFVQARSLLSRKAKKTILDRVRAAIENAKKSVNSPPITSIDEAA
ncbi:MAG: response regulator [Burkholderiaceae bacterium]|jgi:DNA-binding NarL/FixJ family response regulator